MALHRFQIGQLVVASAFGVPSGPHEITQLLPPPYGVPFYRARSRTDGHERAIAEQGLRSAPMPTGLVDGLPRGPKVKAR